jgi:hypothetical protein
MRKILGFCLVYLMLSLSFAAAQESSPKFIVIMDENLVAEDANPSIAAAWYGYALSHVNWVNDHYKDKDPTKDYKLTFEEELFCRNNMVQIWSEIQEKTPGLTDTYLDEVLGVRDAGFLDEYVWTYHAQEGWPLPEDLKLEEFNDWMAQNLSQHESKTLAGIQIE